MKVTVAGFKARIAIMQAEVATHIELRENRAGQGRAYIAGTRTRVQDVYVLAEVHGLTPDQIVEQLPHLTLGQVHAALSYYYFDHREQILNELREDEEFVRQMRAQTGPGPLEQRLGALRGDDAVSS
jgi:uncharacterized protein (DUF433 family)